jgi:predicted ATP-dependent endonuclease of OLD family
LNNSISDPQFEKNFTPPWEIFNRTLNDYNMPYRILEIKAEDFDENVKEGYFKIIHNQTNTEIKSEKLSSGEQIFLGLLTKMFLSQEYEKSLEFPELILLDEPDALLHPELIKLLIEVVQNIFIKKYHIKVILTTHSPTTVALSPEDSVFELKNFQNTALSKIEKDNAIKILTTGISTLSIDYKNHKQVFVEAPNDRFYYQSLHDKISTTEALKFKLYFMSSEAGKVTAKLLKMLLRL